MRGIATFNVFSNAVLLVALAVGTTETALAQRGGGFGGFGGPSEPEPSARVDIEELRRNYPFRSLKKRLEYERQRQSANVKPKLSEAAAARLERLDEEHNRPEIRIRTQSLQMLHSDQVGKFIKASGFGIGRGVPPPPSAHQLPPPKDPGRLKLSGILTSVEEDGPPIALRDEEPAEPVPGNWSPSKEALLRFPEHAEDDFANGPTLGYVKSLDEVAGFEPHAFRRKPELDRGENLWPIPHDWKVSRLELVSLLKQPAPRVYVSEYLPRMQELDEKVTRAVTPFETAGLKQLRAGEEVHVEAKLNAIRMVGAIRAGKKCIECHQVQRGELLGAFTYEFKRVPPLPVPKRRVI